MAPPVDPRRVAGNHVYAKAEHITNHAEARRRFGSNASTKMISGTVISAAFKAGGARGSWFITADYELPGAPLKRMELNSRSVPAGESTQPIQQHPGVTQDVGITRAPANIIPSEEDDCDRDPRTTAYSNPEGTEINLQGAPEERINAHGTLWQEGNVLMAIGGTAQYRNWSCSTITGERLGHESNKEGRTTLFYFMAMFPRKQLSLIVVETNKQLKTARRPSTTIGEVLKLFGVMILISRFEFGTRSTLWSRKRPSKYIPAPQLGETGMSRDRFDTLIRQIRFSEQPSTRPSTMSSEMYRWALVQDFVDNFNEHRQQHFSPSDLICVDESMSRWYGLGGFWINMGLPQYIAIDRKPENGAEIQNAACGRSGIMLKLKLVKTIECEDDAQQVGEDGLPHGTKVLKELVHDWAMSDRTVCADSYFASVTTAEVLRNMGLRFIGVVKTATRHFPMKRLAQVELEKRGDRRGLVHMDAQNEPSLLAFVWMDRERRYFITSCSSLAPGAPYSRKRWRQLQDVCTNQLPELVELSVPQPRAAEIYYSCCGMIDRHNRCRQDDLMLERKLGTKDWSMTVNNSILAMIIVDSWLLYKGCTGDGCIMDQADFYSALAVDLIDNTYDGRVSTRRRVQPQESAAISFGVPQSGIGPHLTPTKKLRKNSRAKQQGRCIECRAKTSHVCSLCRQEASEGKEPWVCHSKTGASCFARHMARVHNQ